MSRQFLCELNGIRVDGHAVDTALDQEFAEFRIYGRSLAADGNRLAGFVSHFNQMTDRTADCQIAFVINVGDGIVITVAAQDQHGQVVGTDGIPVHKFIELIRQNNVGRNLSHQPDLKVFAPGQPLLCHNAGNLAGFVNIAAERNHHVQVLQAKLFANFPHSLAFQFKGFNIFRIIVTGRTAPA